MRMVLNGGRFDRLEAIADSLAFTHARWPSGRLVLGSFYEWGFGHVNNQGDGAELWSAHLAKLREWTDARPGSDVARFALAEALIGRAWAARGGGWANTVSRDRWQRFGSDLEEAGRMLMQCGDSTKVTYEWHSAFMSVLHGIGGQGDSLYRVVAEDALARFPDEPRFYAGVTNHLLPRWYGQPGDWERFAAGSTADLPDSIRDEFYARVVAEGSRFEGNVFQESRELSWSRTQRGLLAWHRRFPRSTQPTSALAKLAWMAGDRGVARQAFASLRDTVDLEVWRTLPTYWAARQWVEKGPS
jgi:hypothetical protein